MAFRHMDGFGHYAIADIGKKYNSVVTTGMSLIGSAGRWGGVALRGTNGAGVLRRSDLGNQGILIAAVNYKVPSALPGSGSNKIFQFWDSATRQITLIVHATTGALEIRSGDYNGTLLQNSQTYAGFTLSLSTWYNIQLKLTFATGTSGAWECRINGSQVVLLGTGNTAPSTNAQANTSDLWIAPGSGGFAADYSDLWICDGNSPNNDFAGDIRIGQKLVNGAGNYTQWTPSAGSNYQNVDDSSMDNDTTYNSDATVGHKDSYTLAAASATGTIKAVSIVAALRKDDANTRQVRPFIRDAGGDHTLTTVTLGSGYAMLPQCMDKQGDGTTDWDTTALDAFEVGVETIA